MSSRNFPSHSAKWNAVKQKDISADGVFVYAVRTTKVYCRPVCKARLAREANVSFYDTPDEAQRAGYRPCKRCKPDLSGEMPEKNAASRVRAMVEANGAGGGLAEMARQAGLSKWHFHRVFKEVTNMTPTEYLRQQSDDSSSYPTSCLGARDSEPQGCGVTKEMAMPLAMDDSMVTAGLPTLLSRVTPELGSDEAVIDAGIHTPMLYDFDFNLDDLPPDLYAGFFEELSHVPAEYEPTDSDLWPSFSMVGNPDWV